ncbi:MAG: hypothetical protein WAK84_08505 [Candidatus Cybelea sp.]
MAQQKTIRHEPAQETLIAERLGGFLAAVNGAHSVEVKVTVPETSHRSALAALGIDPLEVELRQVYFFDTSDLALNARGLIVRARRVKGKVNDSVVKLRRGDLDGLPNRLRKSPNLVVEVDAMPGGYVCSASMKGTLGTTDVMDVTAGRRPINKLFSKEQQAFYTVFAPHGLELSGLSILGPINVFKLKFRPAGLERKLVVEQWNYPDGSRILELSTKATRDQAIAAALDVRSLLTKVGVNLSDEQRTKTKTALEFFSRELRAS